MHALLLSLLAASSPADTLTAPGAVADRGAVRTGPPLVHTFRVTNRAPTLVRLLGVTTPCGCLAPAVDRDALPPGESATVTLVVNTLTPAAGPQTWRGVVRAVAAGTDGRVPEFYDLPWSLSAELVREVALTPPAVAVTAAGDAPVSVVVTVTDRRAKPLAVLGVASPSPHLTAAVGPAAGGSTPVTVTLHPGLPAGETTLTLAIHTSDPACPELRLPVTLSKRPPTVAVARPATAALVLDPGEESASMLVQLVSPTGRELKLASATSDDARVGVTAAAAGRFVTARVRVTPGGAATGGAAVTVTLSDPPGSVTVPVSWSRRTR